MMKDTTTFPELIDIVEVARIMGRSVVTIRRWDKKLKPIRLTTHGKRMYKKSDIDDFIKNGEQK